MGLLTKSNAPKLEDTQPYASIKQKLTGLESQLAEKRKRVSEIDRQLGDNPEAAEAERAVEAAELAKAKADAAWAKTPWCRHAEGDRQTAHGALIRAKRERDAIAAKPPIPVDVLQLLDANAAKERRDLEDEQRHLIKDIDVLRQAIQLLKPEVESAREEANQKLLEAFVPDMKEHDRRFWDNFEKLLGTYDQGEKLADLARANGLQISPYAGHQRDGYRFDGLRHGCTLIPQMRKAYEAWMALQN